MKGESEVNWTEGLRGRREEQPVKLLHHVFSKGQVGVRLKCSPAQSASLSTHYHSSGGQWIPTHYSASSDSFLFVVVFSFLHIDFFLSFSPQQPAAGHQGNCKILTIKCTFNQINGWLGLRLFSYFQFTVSHKSGNINKATSWYSIISDYDGWTGGKTQNNCLLIPLNHTNIGKCV